MQCQMPVAIARYAVLPTQNNQLYSSFNRTKAVNI